VVDADIQAFFDSIDHETLLDRVADRISDGTVLRWLREMLKAGVLEDGPIRPRMIKLNAEALQAAEDERADLPF
jgi:retron-type reverse transcriptase